MSTLTLNNLKRSILTAILVMAMVMMAASFTFAAQPGHFGGKPDIGQGDGIPQPKPGTIRAGEQREQGEASQGDGPGNEGQQNNTGEAAHGDSASEGGDGIPNGGPIEGTGHKGKGGDDLGYVFSWLSLLF